ncbi:MAG: PQQ-binding-like beta-propeller repeat protein [Armatimonadetes bacterium]|nr:PQQ-binding-like beta-propeller repeat protein [Armatimonadota bacterium]
MLTQRTILKKLQKLGTAVVAVGVMALVAVAQDFPMHSANPNRTGLPVDVNAGAFPPQQYNDFGRGFLRWWDPVVESKVYLDNDQTGVFGTSFDTPNASWGDPTPGQIVAFNYYKALGVPQIYRYSGLVKGTSADDPAAGSTRSYSFQFNNLSTARAYSLSLNIPVGPSDVGGGTILDLRYPQKYMVVRVTGAQGGDHTDVINYDTHAGDFVRLGNNGDQTTLTFTPTGTTLTVTVFNTAPVGENGQFLDPALNANPALLNQQLVYADAVGLGVEGGGSRGVYTAAPIVGRLNAPPPGGGTESIPWRVSAARSEPAVVGDLDRNYNLGVVTSYDALGFSVAGSWQTRYNKVFSWPARRPFDGTDAELSRYGRDKRDWIMAAGKDRTDQHVVVDNLNGGFAATANFLPSAGGADDYGPTFASTPAISGAPTEEATFGQNMPAANYFIDVWMPGNNGPRKVQMRVLIGGTQVDLLDLDESQPRGWYRVPFQRTGGYAHSDAQPLQVVITNQTTEPLDAGKDVHADAVRFVRQADLGIDSTPLQVTTTVQTGGGPVNRDVLVVAMENGRLYCTDAHGDPTTGAPPQVYWTYPTEGSTDPNNDPAEDGKDRIAETAAGFDLTSALVANVGGTDLLFVASQNGKVYCIEMSGRGDGTARRRWTWPDDYDPSAPNVPMQAGVQPIVGSLSFGTAAGNVPIVIVPTQEGRVIALDAAGNLATKKSSIVWQYPLATDPVLGPVQMTPVVTGGRVFFGAAPDQTATTGTMYALNEGDGTLAWTQDGAGIGGFSRFGASSPISVPASMLNPPAGTWGGTADTGNDRLFVADDAGLFASLDPASGTVAWSTNELPAGSAGPLRFLFTAQYDNIGSIRQDIPAVIVTTVDGRLTALSANGLLNKAGFTKVWGYAMDGQAQVSPAITGGFNNGLNVHSWAYAGDSSGYLYAFNSILDTKDIPMVPGVPPGFRDPGQNDPDLDLLDNAIDPNKFILISPEQYDQLRQKIDDPNVGVTAAEVLQVAQNSAAQRRHFDFGETLYVLIYDLPEGTGSTANYYIEFEMSSPGRTAQRFQSPIRQYTGDAQNRGFVLRGIPLMTTGIGGIGPGPNLLSARATSAGTRNQGTAVRLFKPATFNPPVNADYFIANPLALAYLDDSGIVNSSVCLPTLVNPDPTIVVNTGDPRWPLYNSNGNVGTDQNPAAGEPAGPVGPDLRSKGQPVSHGSLGVQQLYVVDRSLMAILLGRGLDGVRVGPRDIAWVKDLTDPTTGGVFQPLLQNGVNYPGFEDYPVNVPNTSLDYPNVGREGLAMTANLFGQAQNPLYPSGISLNAPFIAPANATNYRTLTGYEAQMTRRVTPTVFEMSLLVPRYQPSSKSDYYGSQIMFIDPQGGNSTLDPTVGSFRTFGIGLDVARDQRINFQTPTLDMGSLPSGGGYNGGAGFGPFLPWDPNTQFSPWNPAYNNLFQPFAVSNDGNENMLDLRLAKFFFDANGNRPVELFMPGQHELAWLDASLHLHSSIDRRYSASLLVGSGPGFDPLGRNILQKPRPNDLIGTRYNVNPRSRPNANLRTAGGYLFNPGQIVPGDPKIGVSAPIGAPSGQYIRKVFAFENSNTGNDMNADNPSLGTDEAYTDPGANLKFTVREGRMTNLPTTKSAPMVESLPTATGNFLWSNSVPSAMRDGNGNVFVAWASNRLENANTPGWNAMQRTETDLLRQDKWRIYVGSLRSTLGNSLGESPINDLNAWTAENNSRWYKQTLLIDPPANVFSVDTANGETLDLDSVAFGAPTFPTSGFFNFLEYPATTGRSWNNGKYMAMLGEATKRDASGTSVPLSEIMLVPMTFAADGTINYNPGAILTSPFDPTVKKSRLSLVNTTLGSTSYASVFYSTYSNGLGQIVWNNYNSTSNLWTQGSLRLGNAFENLGAPSAFARRYRDGNQGRINLTFTGKVRGRKFSEVYMARLTASLFTGVPTGRNSVLPYGTATDPLIDDLTLDPATGVFWAPGLQWVTDQASLDQIDITTDPSGATGSIWDQKTATRDFDQASGILKFNSRFGGSVLLESSTGAVRMTGVILPRGTRLYIKYRPSIVRVSTGTGANYRSVATTYDDRFIGVRVVPGNPQRNLLGDLQNWVGEVNAAQPDSPLRWDRTVVAYTRTSGDGTAAARPFYQTLRPGIVLANAIQTDQNGAATYFRVDNWGGGVAVEHYAQFDPATGRVFFLTGNEDRRVTVTYDAVDESGRFIGRLTEAWTVRQIPELLEQAVPIEQVGNESGLSIALDPLNSPFNNIDPVAGRKPGLLWFFWSSSRTGQPDVYFQTVAPRFSPKRPNQ